MLSVKTTLVAGTPAELAQKLLAKEIDAFWYGSGIPSPPFVQIADKAEAVVFGLASDEARALRRLFPYFVPYEIAAGTYRGQTEGTTLGCLLGSGQAAYFFGPGLEPVLPFIEGAAAMVFCFSF